MNYKHIDLNNFHQDKSKMYKVLDNDGNLLDKNYKTTATQELLLEAYGFMVLSRQQDTYVSQLQRQGRSLTFAPNFGEEGLQVAVSMAMEKDDWFIPAFRANATMLHLGVPLENQMYYWNGNEKGSKMPEGVNVLPINIPIGTQCSHAAGIAYGLKLAKKKNASVSFIGNGGTAEGEFYEAMNTSSIHKWPTVFCVNNNQWAISTPNHLESGSTTIAAKAVAVGIPAIRVDGNDVLASYEVMVEALDYAKSGKGPILVEFITWRQGPHTSSDNPRIYRTAEIEKENEKNEPFHRIEKYLMDNNFITKEEKEKLEKEKLEQVKQAFKTTSQNLEETIDEIFDYTYEVMPQELLEQKEELQQWLMKAGK
ncbi:pyruvate dehydrogenase (acetyl-transferring) E1 component subunit alpha [Candidatus Mycoplasma mahonii]|uniref:pyruvate dehydrogenase (acetyl-transferring) E1 component subunit alpha n=1 Tax=Candidatus Mycoplasma mahonii TaxID=3004105 RepID=UPI0026F1785D|nr:pyruvate dehydrogenase (acetyl-transferring) E1 component subunit alpha [Candidatus Mycoplasma mahonii]WKX02451.1 pyruvate dehydrogenase (acetyl-transferring) E1 component subunit alpha [Candidatus Mycoplasma mahonii]